MTAQAMSNKYLDLAVFSILNYARNYDRKCLSLELAAEILAQHETDEIRSSVESVMDKLNKSTFNVIKSVAFSYSDQEYVFGIFTNASKETPLLIKFKVSFDENDNISVKVV